MGKLAVGILVLTNVALVGTAWAATEGGRQYVVVGDGAVALRTGCEAEDDEIAKVPAGSSATIRFAMNGCYSVRLTVQGQELNGFLPAKALEGVANWDEQRRTARNLDSPRSYSFFPTNTAAASSAAGAASAAGTSPLQNASQLILDNRPAEALTLLEREIQRKPKDAQLLAMAGLAAYRADASTRAIDYLRASQGLHNDASVALLLQKAEQEKRNDKSSQTLESPKFSLRFEPEVLSTDQARTLSKMLEQEYRAISFEVGCAVPERLAAIAQSRAAYMRSTGAAEWSGGQFDGRIRVAVMDGDGGTSENIGPNTRRAFAHEIVHACLAASGLWPAWFHEGLAQKLSGDRLNAAQRAEVRAAAKSGALPALSQMNQSWSRMSADHAQLAYQSALLAMELFYEHHHAYGIRNLIKNPDQLPRIAADLDRLIRAE